MSLTRLKLIHFKNYMDIDICFSQHVNCILGKNGVGKTTILDAIHYLSFCKSNFTPNETQNILHGENFFAIHGFFSSHEEPIENQVSCIFQSENGKSFLYNQKKYSRLADHIGKIPLVMVSPADQDLITGGSVERRKFLDSIIAQTNPSYLESLIAYQKVLEQRNKLLKIFAENRQFDKKALEIWDVQLCQFGHIVYEHRKKFIEEFRIHFLKYHQAISPSSMEEVGIQYESQLSTADFSVLLNENLKKDLSLQYTSVGIHKDELVFSLNQHPIRKTGSQGQQKTYLLALKLANFDYLKKNNRARVVLLLDDIFDKLDRDRVQRIMKIVGEENYGQVFLTDTESNRLEGLIEEAFPAYKIFEVQDNQIQLLRTNE